MHKYRKNKTNNENKYQNQKRLRSKLASPNPKKIHKQSQDLVALESESENVNTQIRLEYNDIVFVESAEDVKQKVITSLTLSDQKFPNQFSLTFPPQESPMSTAQSKQNEPLRQDFLRNEKEAVDM